jgi:hypothetical protein
LVDSSTKTIKNLGKVIRDAVPSRSSNVPPDRLEFAVRLDQPDLSPRHRPPATQKLQRISGRLVILRVSGGEVP